MSYYVLLEYTINLPFSLQTFYLTAYLGKISCKHQNVRDIFYDAANDFSFLNVRRYHRTIVEFKMKREKLNTLISYKFQFSEIYNDIFIRDITDNFKLILMNIPPESVITASISRYNIIPDWENSISIFRL